MITRRYHRLVAFFLLTLLSFMVVVNRPALSADARQLLQAGVNYYEQEQFATAVEVWNQALAGFTAQDDELGQALVQSNLSVAYQHLGRWEEAEEAIATSLNLLQSEQSNTSTQPFLAVFAKALNTQGRLHWSGGRFDDALDTWRQATLAYQQANDIRGVVLSSINQAEALQALGLSVQAEATLGNVYEVLQQQPLEPSLVATGLWYLGNAQRRLGYLNQSHELLQESLAIATSLDLPSLTSSILLDLGNTNRALSDRAIAIGKADEAQPHQTDAIAHYQQAASRATLPIHQIQAKLNQLSLLAETGQTSDAAELWLQIQPDLTRLPTGRSTVFATLNAVRSLICLRQQLNSAQADCLQQTTQPELEQPPPSLPDWSELAQLLATAIQQARTLQDSRSEAFALGQLGELYELTRQWSEAQAVTQQALLKTETIQAPDIRYRWEWQMGRLLEKQGDRPGAIAAYTAAFETLKSVRSDLLTINSDVQFSFRSNVEPVYRRLVSLLLQSEVGREPSQDELKQAIEVIDALQLAEIENFLRCTVVQATTPFGTEPLVDSIGRVDPTAAIIYPIILEDRLELVYRLPGQPLQHYTTAIAQHQVEQTLTDLRTSIVARNRPEMLLEKATQVYDWIIRPLEADLAATNTVKTLVFVLDGALRNIPMSVLHDGERYLIEKPYAVAIAPSLQLVDLQPPSGNSLEVLTAGVSEARQIEGQSFSPLANVTNELQQIEAVASTELLLNQEFTRTNLQQQIDSGDFSIVHVATHGQFSSDPDATFIVAYSELLKSQDLNDLLRTDLQDRSSFIELLVLSACETAQGDERATLGLAGIAVRAGARSTVSTLWQVSDSSTAILMGEFYNRLTPSTLTKAEALHQAQLALFNEYGYRSPYIWAPYVLVGNWL
ncbi:CHAT domain-containing protein [Oculatella sp. FACHB-28]|uniref:CHAT domain-containing protein n=1 Tax=Oculatella sp. FACHB-28 TaxID=2692845 RepID=UPI0018EF7126